MSRRLLNILIIALLLLNLGTLAALWWPKPGHGPASPALRHMDAELGLSAAQRAEIDALRRQHFEQTHRLHRRIADGKKAIIEQLAAAQPDSLAVAALEADVLAAEAERHRAFAAHFLAIKAVCTPAQREGLGDVFLRAMRPPGPPPPGPRPR